MATFDWDSTFCICTQDDQDSGACSAPAHLSNTNAENACYGVGSPNPTASLLTNLAATIPGLKGQWSSTAGTATTADTTFRNWPTLRHGSWSAIDNAKADDGSYAVYTPPVSVEYMVKDSTAIGDPFLCCYGSDPPAFVGPGDPLQPTLDGGDYLVLTNYGLNIPAGATIVGIGVMLRGSLNTTAFATPTDIHGDPDITQAKVFSYFKGLLPVMNVALCTGGNFYYALDPDSVLSGNVAGDGNYTLGPYSTAPYPPGSASCGVFTQGEVAPIGDFGGGLQNSSNAPISDIDHPDSVIALGPVQGTGWALINNTGSGLEESATISVVKNFQISTLKQSWSPAEVNDPSFGFAFNLTGTDSETILHSFDDSSHNTLSQKTSAFKVQCGAIVVYYTGGVETTTPATVHQARNCGTTTTTDPTTGGDCGCGGGTPGTGGTGGGTAGTSDCYSKIPSTVWEASIDCTSTSNDGKCSQKLMLKDSQDLTNVDPLTGLVTSPWYAKCILSALAPCSSPNFLAFGGFWNWMFQNKNPDLLFTMRVGVMFFDANKTFVSENVWNYEDPQNGSNSWLRLPGGNLVVPVPAGASFFRYQCVAMVAVAAHGGTPFTVNTGTGNNYASFLFDSLYAIQQGAGSTDTPVGNSGGQGTGTCTGTGTGSTGTGGGETGGGTGGTGGGTVPGGGGNPSGTATVTSTAGHLTYTTTSSNGDAPHTIQLDWDAAPNIPDPVTNFKVYRGTSVGAEELLATTAGNVHTYLDTTAVATETYYYYITAVNVDGESGHLDDVSVLVPLPGGFIEWQWHGVTVFWSDGSTSAPPDGSITQSGLDDGLLFFYFPYYDFASNSVLWVTGGSGDAPGIAFVASTPAELATQSLAGRTPLFPNLSAGTSGGPPGGGF